MSNVPNLSELQLNKSATPEQAPPAATPAPTKATPAKTAAAAAAAPRVSLQFWGEQYRDMRAAYLADWEDGGTADTLGEWVQNALRTHAKRSPAKREAIATTLTRPEGRGKARSFAVSAEVDAAVKEARKLDAHRYLSASRWLNEAIMSAVQESSARRGGELPTPPERLPNRMPPRE